MKREEQALYLLLLGFLVAALLLGLAAQGPEAALSGFIALQTQPARLISDFTAVAGSGAALFNAAVVSAIGLGLVRLADVRLSGPTFATVLTMFGFGLFGKTPLNILPILAGVFLASRAAKRSFKEYILIALFGTALGPLSISVAMELGSFLGWPIAASVIAGALAGIGAGFLLPSAAISMLHLHQGYNLYNMGFTCGFLGLFAASLMRAAGLPLPPAMAWSTDPGAELVLIAPLLSASLIAMGIARHRSGLIHGLRGLLKASGRLPSDFMDTAGQGAALVNAGMLGLLAWCYAMLVGAPCNGPVLGGIFTVIGFGAFGKHPLNAAPVMAGAAFGAFAFGKGLNQPGPILAALFATTLAPIAGEFGVGAGLLAGFVHLAVVMESASWHGGIDLYNNGFSGGLVAALFVAFIQWARSNRAAR
jgi:hypothetical protein